MPTRVEGGHKSIIDYLECQSFSRSRVSKSHVETREQEKGANGCGSDHNLLWVDWKLWSGISEDAVSSRVPRYCVCWKKDALSDPVTAARYTSLSTPSLSSW